MFKFCLLLFCFSIVITVSEAQNVGIGTASPLARLHVTDSAVLFQGPAFLPFSTLFAPPASGAGVRFMWYPQKVALRAGYVAGPNWDKDSIGLNSIGLGYDVKAFGAFSTSIGAMTTASGSYSTSMGGGTRASGQYSTSLGSQTTASGYASTSLGSFTTASGQYSTSLGYGTTASGQFSTSMGYSTTASGNNSTSLGSNTAASGLSSTSMGGGALATGAYSTSMGYNTLANGVVSLSIGNSTTASGANATSMGYFTKARSDNSLVIGTYNDTSATDRIFEIGDGTADNVRNNALTVLANGNAGFGTSSPSARLQVADSAVLFQGPAAFPFTTSFGPPASGAGVRFMWYPQKAALRAGYVAGTNWDKDSIGLNSIALGYNAKAKGDYSTSLGTSTTASGGYSTSIGLLTVASGLYATSMGYSTTASGNHSTSLGSNTAASGLSSTSMGGGALATGAYSTSMGYNTLANGVVSLSIGNSTTASGANATSMGYFTKARSDNSLVIGAYNDTSNTNRLFEIGNGTNANARSNALTVLTNGYIGIGLTNPSRPLSFPATLEKKISFYPGATGDVGISVSGNDLRLYADNANARVSFGYDDFTTGFTSRAYVLASGTTALVVQGNMTVNGTNYNSDARFKKHIQPLQGALDKVTALQGVQYEMRVNEFPDRNFQQGTEIGLIAQEVEKVLPELVRTDADGYKSVDYAKLVPVLIEGMKTQQQEIEQLRAELQAFRKLVLDSQGRSRQ